MLREVLLVDRQRLDKGAVRCSPHYATNLFSFSTWAQPVRNLPPPFTPTITTAKMSPEGLLLVNLWLITASRGRVTASSMLDKLELVRIPEYFCLLTMWRPSCLRALLASRYSAVRGPHSWGRLLSHRRSQIQSQSRLPWQTHCHILRSSW